MDTVCKFYILHKSTILQSLNEGRKKKNLAEAEQNSKSLKKICFELKKKRGQFEALSLVDYQRKINVPMLAVLGTH